MGVKMREIVSSTEDSYLTEGVKDFLNRIPTKQSSLRMETQGAKRIMIEFGGPWVKNPTNLPDYLRKYTELVADMAHVIKKNLTGEGKQLEESFFNQVLGMMRSKTMAIKFNKDASMAFYESLEKWEFDCDTSALLFYDVAKELGIPISIVESNAHAFLKTDNYYFETTTTTYHPLSELNEKYHFYNILSDDEIISMAYVQRGTIYYLKKMYSEAMVDMNRAIKINSKASNAYIIKGVCYGCNSEYEKAIKEFKKVLLYNPLDDTCYRDMGYAYFNMKKYKLSIKNYTKAIEINKDSKKSYLYRSKCYKKIGEINKAKEDMKIYEELK